MKKRLLFGLLFLLIVLVSNFFFMEKIIAASGDSFMGWLWGGSEDDADIDSSNNVNNLDGTGGGTSGTIDGDETGVGWVSMNSRNCDANSDGTSDGSGSCPAAGTAVADYGVTISASSGALSGHAWSENLGWISFNESDLVGCPSGTCTSRQDGNNLKGWARILSIKNEYEKSTPNSGGWQGWVSLSSANCDGDLDGFSDGAAGCPAAGTVIPYYGVDTTKMKGSAAAPADANYAWSEELGWLDFSRAEAINNLKVCARSCDSGGSPYSGRIFQPPLGGAIDLVACYNVSSSCDLDGGDVTALATWTDQGNPDNIISFPTNGRMTSDGSFGEEDVTVSYGTQEVDFTSVIEAPCLGSCDTGCEANTCIGTKCQDSCGNLVCEGTKNCTLENVWREVAP